MISKLRYDPGTGHLWWTESGGRRRLGSPAGNLHKKDGYIRIKVSGQSYRAHRVAWFLFYGEWPDGEIDHINGIRSDNRLTNLRVATRAQNGVNCGMPRTNTSGLKGAHFNKEMERWQSFIRRAGRQKHLGYFDTAEAAHAAYLEAAQHSDGQFLRT